MTETVGGGLPQAKDKLYRYPLTPPLRTGCRSVQTSFEQVSSCFGLYHFPDLHHHLGHRHVRYPRSFLPFRQSIINSEAWGSKRFWSHPKSLTRLSCKNSTIVSVFLMSGIFSSRPLRRCVRLWSIYRYFLHQKAVHRDSLSDGLQVRST